jgi:hypothetical protein
MRFFLLLLAPASLLAQARAPLRLIPDHVIADRPGLSLGAIHRIELGPDGAVVAVDGGNGVIYRFTPTGRLRDSIGRRGQGPGEFLLAAGLGVGPAGEVALADLRTQRLTLWNPDGSLRGSEQLGAMPVALLWRGTNPVAGLLSFAPTPTIRFGPVGLGRNGLTAELGGFPDPRIAEYAGAISCGICRHALTSEGRLLVAAPDTFYRVSELGPAGVVRTWTRTNAGAALRSPEELRDLRNRLRAGPGGGAAAAEGRIRTPDDDALRYRPRFQGIGMDDAGRLLVLASNAGADRPVVDVFASDGRFLGSVLPDRVLQSLVVRGSRVAALGESADGTPAIIVYRIE